jgi:hypothetical protein
VGQDAASERHHCRNTNVGGNCFNKMRDLLLIFTLATILGCTKTGNVDITNSGKVDTLTSRDNAILDSLDFHILEFDSSMRIFPTTYKRTDLSEKEII